MIPEYRVLRDRLKLPLLAFGVTHLVGTAGFYLLWRGRGGTVLDALFMTFSTVTTIGFEEAHPLGTAGRLLAMAVAAGGIGTAAYMFSVVLEHLTSAEVARARRLRRMEKHIDEFSNHYVVAGFGRMGRQAAQSLVDSGGRVVAIDSRAEVGAEVAGESMVFVHGDATSDATLIRAGIQRARGLVVVTDDDPTNMYVVLAARLLSPRLFIVSRAVDESTVPKLERAGADRAVSPYVIGGRRLAHLMLGPKVVEFFEIALQRGHRQLNIGEFLITEDAPAAGRTLESLEVMPLGANLLAVLRDSNAVPPRGDLVLRAGDHLLALGTNEQLDRLEAILLGAQG